MELFNIDPINSIDGVPGLFISDITVPRSPDLLREYGITHVLSLTRKRDFPRIAEELGIQQLHVEVDDNPLEDLLMSLEGVCAWIDNALGTLQVQNLESMSERTAGEDQLANIEAETPQNGGLIEEQATSAQPQARVLVHCIQGISRSGAVIVAHLMRAKSLDYPSALDLARKSRSIITPNSGFGDQLRLWKEMDYTIYTKGIEKDSAGVMRTTKPQYEQWRANRGILLSKGEEAKQQVMRKTMAAMAAQFGKRRLVLKEQI